ncbi:MAG: cell surface protein SprA [Bacteroidetes bacterium]|nr:cell surface protein SprA [Bacteroidota bacterium]
MKRRILAKKLSDNFSSEIKSDKFLFKIFIFFILFTIAFSSEAKVYSVDSASTDSNSLRFPISKNGKGGGIDLPNPENVKEEVTFNSTTGKYEIRRRIGSRYLPGVRELSREEYMAEYSKKINREYFQNQGRAQNFSRGGSSKSPLLGILPNLTKFMGNGLIEIQPTGTAELTLGMNINRVKNPNFSTRMQKPPPQLIFDQNLQLGVTGNIGDRIKIGIKYDTKATFDFENQTKLDWVGKEDDILKKIELGNISMPLNSSLIQGGSSLFGFRTEMQFGRLTWSALFSQNRGQRTEQSVSNGAQTTEFNIQADMYEQNRHFFLSQYFYNNYDNALSNLPIISSGVVINRVEVWVTNKGGMFENTRDVVAFMDLAESNPYNNNVNTGNTTPYPSNEFNALYSTLASSNQARRASTSIDGITAAIPSFEPGFDYEYVNGARKLNENEYTLNTRLGYISLNQALNNDEVLGVAFEYTYNGQVYKVGEFSSEVAQDIDSRVLFIKMLKSTTVRTKIPMWHLMMKNIYSLNTNNLNLEDFYFDVVYADDPSGADLNYLPVENVPGISGGVPLLRVFNLDRINRQQEAKPDGIFDAIDGITINRQRGQVIFPVAEPFGSFLKNKFGGDSLLSEKYTFTSLYDSTRSLASQDVLKNKFFLKGKYKGTSSAEIMLNSMNVPPGSVQVFANGNKLKEGSDYIVDYNIGKVTILNQGILSSGANITVSSENQTMFNTQQKTMIGSRFDYAVNKKLNLGGTIMHMYERPLTPKTIIGEDPLMNTIFGFDGIYNSKSRFLTKLVDKIPFIETKEESSILIQAEYAQLIPGKPRSIEKNGERGISYIDDFEAAEVPFELRQPMNWKLASIPQKQPDLFPEWNNSVTDKTSWLNYRSQIAWYTVDPTFYRNDRNTPQHIKDDIEMQSNHYMREVTIREVYQNRELQQGVPNILPTLDIAFFPKDRGPYNYNANTSDFNSDGTFNNPTKSWSGIMRKIETNDFEAANIDYIEIWMMDPFKYNPNTTNNGKLYINLGNISEDILPDRRKSYENGFPKNETDRTTIDQSTFGYVPLLPQINFAFDNESSSRTFQDIGLDGLNDSEEREFYKEKFLDSLANNFGTNSIIYKIASADPSGDNYLHSRDPIYDDKSANIIERYKKYNNHQGNSTLELLPDGSPKSSTTTPDAEDINNDFTMSQNEDYFQYSIDISHNSLKIGQNFVTDSISTEVELKNGQKDKITWYQFKIPIRSYNKVVGNISDFKSIRFMRLFMKGFEDSVILRIAQLQLVRSDWRRHLSSLKNPGVSLPIDPNDKTVFSVSTVNIEANGNKKPFPYVTPPNTPREIDPITPGAVKRNEQSIALNFCNLAPDDARGAFKTMNLDIRNYKYLKMFVHAEGTDLQDNELSAFIRLGTDVVGNYYEYEIPLKVSELFNTADNNIWPLANNLNFELEEFFKTKQERANAGSPMSKPFVRFLDGGARVTLIGLPDLSNVRVIMIGVRNRSNREQCGEVWFNELRVTDISNGGGWAATGRVVAQLADFSTVNLSGSIKTIGFGAIDQRLNQRSLTNQYQYDVNSNIELGKFFPQKLGVTIPMFIGYNENIIRPKFNPLNPDIELSTTLSTIHDAAEKEKVKLAAEDFTSRYSLNFINVRKNRVENKKQKPWDIENFNLSYSVQKLYRRNQQIEEQIQNTYKGSIGYMFSLQPKPWEPFKKIKSKHLTLIKDFNLYLYPQSANIRLDIDRYYSELQNRSNDLYNSPTPRLFDKNFTINRFYTLGWQISRNLKFDYQSTANGRIGEPVGRLDTEAKRDSVRREFFSMGELSGFNQTANLTYTIPINKIKFFNWVQINTRYSANFEWLQPPPAAPGLGSTIQNSRSINGNATLNLTTFYNKFKVFRQINSPSRNNRQNNTQDSPKSNGKEDKQDKGMSGAAKNILRFITLFKQITFNYTSTSGIALPGFNQTPDYFGNNFNTNTPGWDFILGGQDPSIRYKLAEQGFLSLDPQQANFYTQLVSNSIQSKITVEPIKDMRIDFDFNLSESRNIQSNFRFDPDSTGTFRDIGLREVGQFTRSGIFWRTAFDRLDGDKESKVFNQFKDNRYVIAQRLQNQDNRVQHGWIDSTTKYPVGYSQINPDVLINSFYAAYTGKNNSRVGLNIFKKMPLPSWRMSYNGLGKIESLKRYFTSISLTHSYNGIYSFSNYTSELRYSKTAQPEIGTDFVSQYQVGSVTITENFSPLAGINIAMKNDWNFRFEYRKTRMVSLLVANQQLTENRRNEWSIAVGYRAKEVLLPIRWRGKRIFLKNDLNFMMDVSMMDNVMIRRDLTTPLSEPTQGSRTLSIRPTLDYMVNDHINLSLYFDHRRNKPKTSQAFPTSLTEFGIKMRYNL